MKTDQFAALMRMIRKLEEAGISYNLAHHRYDGITITAAVPGERWEIDFLEDGEIDFERFYSKGDVMAASDDMTELHALIAAYSADAPEPANA